MDNWDPSSRARWARFRPEGGGASVVYAEGWLQGAARVGVLGWFAGRSCGGWSATWRSAFLNQLGGASARVAEQAGARGRIALLRNAVEGRMFSAAHKSQRVYHGPVAYVDDPYRRLENASSELGLALLLVFLKEAAQCALREYRFLVWADDEPAEDVLDLAVPAALVDAMRKPRPGAGTERVRAVTARRSTSVVEARLATVLRKRGSGSRRYRPSSAPATRP